MLTDLTYAAHERLVGPGRENPALWRLVAGLFVIAGVAFVLNMVLQSALMSIAPEFWRAEFSKTEGYGNSALPMLIMLGSFGFVTAGVAVAASLMQKRDLAGIIGPFRETLAQFWQVLRMLIIVSVVLLVLPPYSFDEPMIANLRPGLWLMLLPVSVLAILIQVGAEEVLFRGYIQQALAARFKSPLIWMVLPAGLFALGHYLPAEAGSNAGLIALWAGVFGLLMADLTARAGTLGPAIAVHLINNVSALLLVSLPDSLNGLSLYTAPFSMADQDQMQNWLIVDFAMMLVSWLAARLAIRR